jgi:hypothetical protein
MLIMVPLRSTLSYGGVKMKKTLLTVLLVSLAAVLSLGTLLPTGSANALTGPVAVHGVKYITGGVGIEERDLLKTAYKDYNLKLVFAMTSREYLASIKTVVSEPGGKTIFETVTDGPWLLARLPEGHYMVTAYYHQKEEAAQVDVGKGLSTVCIDWKK